MQRLTFTEKTHFACEGGDDRFTVAYFESIIFETSVVLVSERELNGDVLFLKF